jgi:hypothetical protein
MPPQMIHGIQFRRSHGQKAQLNLQLSGQCQAVGGGMRRAAILKHYNVPTPPMGPNHVQKVLVSPLVPHLSDQQQHRACADIERSINGPLGPVTADRHLNLLAAAAVTTV